MVRARKEAPSPAPSTLQGSPSSAQPGHGQAVRAAPGQGYGERGAQEAAQRVLPLAAAPDPAGTLQRDPLDAARAMPFEPSPLLAPTARPREPVTAGLPTGTGPGPEALQRRARTADVLEELAALTGDRGLAMLAARARAQGR